MAAVVLNVEPDLGREQPQQHGQKHALPPRLGLEYQQAIRAREAGEEDGRLHIHLPTVALPLAGGSKMLLDPPPELALEGIVVPELEASCRFCGSKGLARRARVDLVLVCHRTIPRLRVGALVAEVSTGETPQGSCPTPDAVPVTRSPPSLAQSGGRGNQSGVGTSA